MDRKNKLKFAWSATLFVEFFLTLIFIVSNNIVGCFVTIILGIYIAKKGDPIIFEEYNNKKKEKYERLVNSKNRYY